MLLKPLPSILIFALLATPTLHGCDHNTNLTEQEHIQRAKDFEDKGNLKAGIIELKNAIQKNPDGAQARLLLGEIYLRLGKGDEAEKEFSRAGKLGVNPESLKLQLGKAWLLMGEYKQVLEKITPSANASQRNKAAILRMHGDALLGLRKPEEGCKRYKDSLVVDPSHVPAYWGLANCAIAKGDLSDARAMIETAIKIDGTDSESWEVLGNFELLNNNLPAAAEAYATALKHDPGRLSALFGRAQIYAFTGKSAEAKGELERIKKLSPNFYGILFVEATLQYAAGKTDQALDSVQRALRSNPDFMPAQLLFAFVQYDKKSYENAAKVLNQYLQWAPGHLEARKLLAATYLKLNQPDRSLDLLMPYIAAGKADAQIFTLAGEARLREDDPSSAKDLFEKAAELVPASAALRTQIGMVRWAAGGKVEAVKELEVSSAMDGKDPRADIALAYYFLAENQFDKALKVIAALEKKLPDSPGTYSLKGMAYTGKGDYARARKNFERALVLKPALVSAAVRLAVIDLQEKNLPAARGRYQAILEKDSKSVPAMVGLAELAALEKKESEYLAWLERAAKVSPTALVPRAMLTKYYLGKNAPLKALTVAREALSGRPNSPEALDMLGQAQMGSGEKENARSTYITLATLAPKSASAQYNLAKAHAAMGDEKATHSALRKALELKPDHVDALAALSALETAAGKYAEAVRLARELQTRAAGSPVGFALEGDALMAEKRYTEAADVYAKGLEKGEDSRLIIKQHLALLRSGNPRKADGILLGWLKAHPQDQIAQAYLAESYTKRGLKREAIEQYEIVLSTIPDNAMALNNLAILYQQQHDPRALLMAEKVYKLKPDSPVHADTLGWILIQRGPSGRGLQLLEKAAAGVPQNPEVRFHYAYALTQAGQLALARQEIGRLQNMKLSPDLEQQLGQLIQQRP